MHSGDLYHKTQIPVTDPMQVQQIRQLVGQAQTLAAHAALTRSYGIVRPSVSSGVPRHRPRTRWATPPIIRRYTAARASDRCREERLEGRAPGDERAVAFAAEVDVGAVVPDGLAAHDRVRVVPGRVVPDDLLAPVLRPPPDLANRTDATRRRTAFRSQLPWAMSGPAQSGHPGASVMSANSRSGGADERAVTS